MKSLLKATLVSIFAVLCTCASPIDITFMPPVLTTYAGSRNVTAYAVLHNTSADTVFLNDDNLTVPDSSNVTDDFFTNVPISLDPLESSGPIELFQFDVPANAMPGTSAVGTYQLLGGVGLANQNNLDFLGSQNFTVELVTAPEPPAALLAGGGLIALALLLRRVRAGSCVRSRISLWKV